MHFFRFDRMVVQNFFNDFLITDISTIYAAHELFTKVYFNYERNLAESIKFLQSEQVLKTSPNKCYNYILINSNILYKLLDSFDTKGLFLRKVNRKDMDVFKQAIIYIGKGSGLRKYKHFKESVLLLTGRNSKTKFGPKHFKMVDTWAQGCGIVIIEILCNSNRYLSLSRESAMIKSAGNNITNSRDSSLYGLMKNDWSNTEILNFGEMILYFSLRECIINRPTPHFPEDFLLNNDK